MPPPVIAAFAGTETAGSFGWRHALAWRQLSVLWQISVSHYLIKGPISVPNTAAALSVAISHSDCHGKMLAGVYEGERPVVTFLERVRVAHTSDGTIVGEFQDNHLCDRLRHVFRIMRRHSLVKGLPETVATYGSCPVVTPLKITEGMEVLVSLDGNPVIASHGRHLFIGADPWQLGVPSVPMLYKVVSNWLVEHSGFVHPMLEPYAAIRLDDLPVTAEQLKGYTPSRQLDGSRARTLRKLRRFARRTGAKFTMMYSSHFRAIGEKLTTISSVMPRSIKEMQLGVQEGVFEIGSHGMIHLRDDSAPDSSSDPMEFLALDEKETARRLEACENEVLKLFGSRPRSFVAPAWGYRPEVTKRIAGERYSAIIDSSQHVEKGVCDVFLSPAADSDYLNMVETFRPGDRMLTYSNPEFWQCYAAAGIPVHYMQHTDTNWHILRAFVSKAANVRQDSFQWRLFRVAANVRVRSYVRVFCVALLAVLRCGLNIGAWRFLMIALTRSSIYAYARAMKLGGYKFVTITDLGTRSIEYLKSNDAGGPLECGQETRHVGKHGSFIGS